MPLQYNGTWFGASKVFGNLLLWSFWKKWCFVSQDCVLFHNTIRHNIAYGDLTASEDKIIEAAKMAELHDTIMEWPKGYDTQVNEIEEKKDSCQTRLLGMLSFDA